LDDTGCVAGGLADVAVEFSDATLVTAFAPVIEDAAAGMLEAVITAS
jgi:hypothetical protein